ncbi:MAG: hypothetical protein IJJ29_11670 [Solobacterium sp.]|nr:hypothetical protein [Solobacterium sp.]
MATDREELLSTLKGRAVYDRRHPAFIAYEIRKDINPSITLVSQNARDRGLIKETAGSGPISVSIQAGADILDGLPGDIFLEDPAHDRSRGGIDLEMIRGIRTITKQADTDGFML